MSSLPTVALAGATGNLGPAILSALLDAGVKVTVLTRATSSSANKIPSHPNQTIKPVDFESVDSLKAAISGSQVVISTVGSQSITSQELLIDATIAAGATRYVTSEFGSDMANPKVIVLPFFEDKLAVQAYVEEKAKANPRFTWTSVRNSAFLDWGLTAGFIINPKAHSATVYDGGDAPFSSTTLATIGRTVFEIVKNLDLTANQAVYIHDAVVTQNQLINIVKKLEGKDAQEWNIEHQTIDGALAWAAEEGKKPNSDPNKNFMGLVFAQLAAAIYGNGYGGNASAKVWNEKLGIPTMSEQQVEDTVAKALGLKA